MSVRSVPRNIDKPNRTAEYVMSFLVAYYSVMFISHDALIAFGSGTLAVYLIYKFTLNKPEGAAFRFWYRHAPIGRMLPSAKAVPKFEI